MAPRCLFDSIFSPFQASLCGGAVIAAVHGYWYLKRLRLDRPLLPENERPPGVEDDNPFKNFRRRIDTPIARRRKLREDRAEYATVEKMKSDLLKATELVGMIREREEKKKELVVCEEELFELEAAHAKRRKVEREDFLFRMRSGLWGVRDEAFDCEADVEEFRRVFADPNIVEEEDGTECHLPLELKHLAYVRLVHIPGVSPFWGIPRLSRRGSGVVYDPVTLQDVEALFVDTRPSMPKKKPSHGRVHLKRVVALIRGLRDMKVGRRRKKECKGDDDQEEEEDSRVELAKELGWWPLEEPYVI
jgi:hypothetical protein